METEQGNDKIKEFMQLERSKGVMGDTRIYYKVQLNTHEIIAPENDLKYNSSWDWLMPVVEKIDTLDATATSITNICCEIHSKCFKDKEIKSIQKIAKPKIEAVWLAIIQFIEWYKEQTQVSKIEK